MKYKVARDPIYSEIFISPVEKIIIDTKPVQRLRFLSQLTGAELVYPGASHTRFAHSLGTMYVAGMYAEHLYSDDPAMQRIIRVAALLHDVGHGPFSHQFDDVVYPMAGIEGGHDEYRDRIILEIMPKYALNSFEKIKDESFKKDVIEDLKITVGEFENIEDAFVKLFSSVVDVFRGEEAGTVEFNIIQGPLGADRIDFILRDSFCCGTRTFGTGAPDRIIRNSLISQMNGKKVLCYKAKVMDDIYAALFGRFMMYKNVYFHKTSRAADLMIQQILRLSFEPLNLKEKVHDLESFIELTDAYIVEGIKRAYKDIKEKEDLTENERKLKEAYDILQRLMERDLWKVVVEMPFSIEGIDPSLVSRSLASETLEKMRKNLKNVLEAGSYDEDDREVLEEIYHNFDDMFVVDTPYKLTLVHPDEFVQSHVLIYTGSEIMDFEEYVKKFPAYRLMTNNLIQILRIYIKKDYRYVLKKYRIIPSEKTRMVTRW